MAMLTLSAVMPEWHWWTILLVPAVIAIVIFSTIGIVRLLKHFFPGLINLPEKPKQNFSDNDEKDPERRF